MRMQIIGSFHAADLYGLRICNMSSVVFEILNNIGQTINVVVSIPDRLY